MRYIPKASPLADDASFAIAETYKNSEQYDKAIAEYRSLNYNFPKNTYYVSALLNIGQLYINLNQDSKAIAVFKTIRAQYPNSPQAKESETRIQNSYIERGMSDSLDIFNTSLPNGNAKNAQQDSLLYAAAYSNVEKNDCPKTVSGMKRYLSKYPNGYFTVDAHYYLADCELANGSNAAAIEDYNYVIAKSPNAYMERSLKNCATLYYNDKNYSLALQRYKQLEEIANDKQNVQLSLNGQLRAAFNLNQYEPCIETGNKLLNLAYADETSKHAAQFYMAKSYLELSKLDQALPLFESVYKNDNSEMGAEALYDVAYINFLQTKYKDAQDMVFKLKDKYPDYNYWKAKAYILLADVLVKTGDDFNAKSTLQGIIDKYDGEDLKKIASQKLQEIKDREAKGKTDKKENENEKKEDKPNAE
jgi:TolA-binding protein